jgi:lipopolysaccharide/colanic/teichoic acid biosynthesis glycosyltransferase
VALDFALALLLLVAFFPLLLVVAVLVKLTSPGPVIYRQARLGRGGRPYSILKFRTMWDRCDWDASRRWPAPVDDRFTPLGRFLRRTHLDELPELWNVLRGEMSLVGPRPERPESYPSLEEAIPGYRGRLQVRPGVTGLAQVQLPPDTDLGSARRKLTYDLYYVHHRGLGLDLRLLLCAAARLLALPSRRLASLLRLPGAGVVEGGTAGPPVPNPSAPAGTAAPTSRPSFWAPNRLHHENAAVSAFTLGAVTAVVGSWLFAAPLWVGFAAGFFGVAAVLSLAFAADPQ